MVVYFFLNPKFLKNVTERFHTHYELQSKYFKKRNLQKAKPGSKSLINFIEFEKKGFEEK